MRLSRFRWLSLVLALTTAGWGPSALATITIPQALSQGQQLGADQEESAGSNLTGMESTANQTAGVGSVQAVGNPADGADSRTGATATGTYAFTLNCNRTTEQNPIFPGGYGLFAANCTYSGSGNQSAVSQFTLGYCLASINGGNCAPGSSNWQYTAAGSGQSVQLASGISVSMGSCPANGSATCSGTLTVDNNTVHTADAGNLTNDATNEVLSGQNGVQDSLEQTYNSGSYQSALQTGNSQYSLGSCTQQIVGGLNGNGIIYTCNHAQEANFNPNACTSTEQCVKWATQTENYTETCNQDIPLSENTCTTNTPVQNCTITEEQAQYTCDDQLQISVVPGCTPGQVLSSQSVPYGGDTFTATLVCENGGYQVQFSFLSTVYINISAGPGASFQSGNVFFSSGASNWCGTDCCSSDYLTYDQSCSGGSCSVSWTTGDPCQSFGASGGGSYQYPFQIINNGYSNGCSLYQNAS